MAEIELKSCPFCGGLAELQTGESSENGGKEWRKTFLLYVKISTVLVILIAQKILLISIKQ